MRSLIAIVVFGWTAGPAAAQDFGEWMLDEGRAALEGTPTRTALLATEDVSGVGRYGVVVLRCGEEEDLEVFMDWDMLVHREPNVRVRIGDGEVGPRATWSPSQSRESAFAPASLSHDIAAELLTGGEVAAEVRTSTGRSSTAVRQATDGRSQEAADHLGCVSLPQ